jgi:hypothetical protein
MKAYEVFSGFCRRYRIRPKASKIPHQAAEQQERPSTQVRDFEIWADVISGAAWQGPPGIEKDGDGIRPIWLSLVVAGFGSENLGRQLYGSARAGV